MDFLELKQIKDETERVQKTYELFDESSRLNCGKASRVEFLTTVRYIERYLHNGDRILDIGAGAGEYSLYFARNGYEVSAIELAESNIRAFRQKLRPGDNVDLRQGNALDLSYYGDESFDTVLLLGPLYHLQALEDRKQCITEAMRVCRKGGHIFFAFIGNDMVIMTEFQYSSDYFAKGDYDRESFRLEDFPFVFHTVDAAKSLLNECGITPIHAVAADGFSELMADKINGLSDEDYGQYLRYHFYICEKPEFLGASNHLLFVAEKG